MANSVFNLSTLNGTNGFAINGINPGDFSGISVSSAGDINGDGIDDLIIGAEGANFNGELSGQSYVVFGRKVGFDSQFNLSNLNGTNGFAINGINSDDSSGNPVSNAGDINGDGIDDLIIGAFRADPNVNYSGQSYVVFGSKGGFVASFDLSTLNGTNGFAINGINAYDRSGYSVSNAGDINGDGIDDLIIGARSANSSNGGGSGQSYVVFGGKGGFDAQFNLSTLNGVNGFTINGINGYDQLGYSTSSAGDINGDGLDDIIIGAPYADPNGSQSGQSYVVFGSKGGFDAQFNLSTLNGNNGFAINGINPVDKSGVSVSSAGDINGDGIDDLIIGARLADPNGDSSGQSYVVFGSKEGFDAQLNLSTLNGTNGFAINGINPVDTSGNSVSSAGDINGDGIDDLIIGARLANPNGNASGQSYVVFGSKGGFDAQLNLSTLNGTNGFAINGINEGDTSGNSVSGAGDINGDGLDDIIIGAGGANPNGDSSGQSYVLFGNRAPGLDLNGNSSGIDFSTTFSGTPVSIVKSNFTLSDNNTTLAGATITITNLLNGAAESLNATAIGNITATYNATTGTLTLSGTDTIANYQKVLNSLTYNNTAATVNTSDRIIEFVVNDGQAHTNTSAVAKTTLGFNLKFTGTPGTDTLKGTIANNIIDGKAGNDTLTGNGGQDKFVIRRGDGNDIITDFGGVGKGANLSAAVIGKVDTLQFTGNGLTARNLQLSQNGNNLEVTFENVANTKVTLQNFKLENLDNLPASASRTAIGNILFDNQTSIADSFDVFDANSTQTSLFNKNTVTFLNDLSNNITGFDNSNDVVNAQGGNDTINGKSGNDLLRGGAGHDTLIGGAGNDILVGGAGADRFLYNTNALFALTAVGVDVISDFKHSQGDKIILDKTTFNAIASAPGTGFSNANDFKITTSASTSTAKIVYDAVSGQLFYNQNGSAAGFGSGGLFATLTDTPTLTASDFVLQA
ncbi:MAG: beta strand repeat-containing protein [Nostoc sp. ChiQUE02]|uniref:beta strand repeat-containing protein n=1 Tax=Nostoc sp. ChiQUE02 TaxID=3075377 RepID=UPI002AD23AC7|nr:hypothetical protein [Nostoc sp. ChiQUE02]MDZ8232456.1 hypothetical protein [Nostoc sp. ChiQUE02]